MDMLRSTASTSARLTVPALLIIMLFWQAIGLLFANGGYILTARSLLGTEKASKPALHLLHGAVQLGQENALWGLALLAEREGAIESSQISLRRVIESHVERLPLARSLYPQDRRLAEWTLEHFPEASLPPFWLGELVKEDEPDRAIALYEQGIRISPLEANRFVELGYLYVRQDRVDEALKAFQTACTLHDRGGNGCWRGGLLAEEYGRLDLARQLYQRTIEQVPQFERAYERLRAVSR